MTEMKRPYAPLRVECIRIGSQVHVTNTYPLLWDVYNGVRKSTELPGDADSIEDIWTDMHSSLGGTVEEVVSCGSVPFRTERVAGGIYEEVESAVEELWADLEEESLTQIHVPPLYESVEYTMGDIRRVVDARTRRDYLEFHAQRQFAHEVEALALLSDRPLGPQSCRASNTTTPFQVALNAITLAMTKSCVSTMRVEARYLTTEALREYHDVVPVISFRGIYAMIQTMDTDTRGFV